MRVDDIQKIAVIGAGEMGHGLAELAALHGFQVGLHDVEEKFLKRGLERIEWSLKKLEKREKLKEKPDQILKRILPSTDLRKVVSESQFVIEAAPEDIELKRKIFRSLDQYAPKNAILASNTSGLSITAMGRATKRAGQVVGMHFFNPPVIMELVEVVKGEDTEQETIELTKDLSRKLGKTPIVCRKDIPGFITTRIIFHYMNEAAWIHHEENIRKEAIDGAMKFKVGFPMGPFELADQVGIDLLVFAQEKQGLPVPPPFKERVEGGKFGKKSGEGFYDYKGEAKPVIRPEDGKEFDPIRILAPTLNEAALLVEMEIAPPEEVDLAMRLGTAFPEGPLALADSVGIDRLVDELRTSKRHKPAGIFLKMVEEGNLGEKTGQGFYGHEAGEVMEFKTIILEKDPSSMRATLTLNRPEVHNAITPEMVEEISSALRSLEADNEVRCLILKGAGERAFCAGADVTAFTGVDKAHIAWAFTKRTNDVFKQLEDFPKPTVAAIRGYTFGGGLELAIACDFRIATKGSKIGATETSLGLIPGAGATQRLARLVGLGRAKEMVFLAKRLAGTEAEAMGLVHRVVEEDEFQEAVDELSKKLAKGPPIAYRLAKKLLNYSAQGLGEAGLDMEALAFSVVTSTEDIFEGLGAFLSKKEPEFKGK